MTNHRTTTALLYALVVALLVTSGWLAVAQTLKLYSEILPDGAASVGPDWVELVFPPLELSSGIHRVPYLPDVQGSAGRHTRDLVGAPSAHGNPDRLAAGSDPKRDGARSLLLAVPHLLPRGGDRPTGTS